MKKVKDFLKVLTHSIIPWPSYYSKILHTQFSSSLKYIITLILLLNIFFVGSILVKINYFKISSVINGFFHSAKNIPSDYRLEIINGRLLTNFSRPYLFWINYQNNKKLILVIDESAQPEKIRQYQSLFLLTSKDLVSLSSGTINTITLSSLGPATIDKYFVQESINVLNNILKFLPFVYVGIIFIVVLITPLLSIFVAAIYLLLASIIGTLAYRFFTKKSVKLKKSLQIAFHASTLPLIVDHFIIVFKPVLPFKPLIVIPENIFPLVFIFLLSLFIFTGIYEAYTVHKRDTMSA